VCPSRCIRPKTSIGMTCKKMDPTISPQSYMGSLLRQDEDGAKSGTVAAGSNPSKEARQRYLIVSPFLRVLHGKSQQLTRGFSPRSRSW
jgi:hypothetical protein